jgi:tetratricopeptide (TPR) repeat protein
MILLDKAGDTLVRGEAAEAMELLSAALEIDAENFEAHIWTGRALIKLDRGQDAQASFRRAGELHPDSPIPPEALGNYYQEVGDEEAAEKEFLRAIEIDPQYESPHFRLIELYEKQGRQADMMGMYEKVLPLSPAGAHNEIAWLMATSEHEDIRDPGAAIKHATLAVEMEPSPWYIDTLAEAYYAAGKYAIAVAVIKEAIAKDPGDMEYYEGQLKKFQDAKKAAFREKE